MVGQPSIAELETDALASMAPAPAPPTAEWHPDLNETQKKIFDDSSRFVLGYGEKGSGKTIAFGHKLIRHAYENDNALVMILSPSIRTGSEGIWHDLETLIIPFWVDGIGLETSSAKLDPNTKDRHRWIGNRHGGWSKLLLISIPYAAAVETRIKGPAPSHIYVDELTQCDGKEYFTYPAAQLGRRRGITGPQQYCASCNPEGPSHWVYKTFFEDCYEEDGTKDDDFRVYHVPVTENIKRLPDGYVENLHRILRTDPVEKRRLIDGEWVDRPTGESLFKEYFVPSNHIKGDMYKGTGLKPMSGFPVTVGYDLGQVYSSITFMQMIPTQDKMLWIVFDEMDYMGVRHLYKRLAQEVCRKMDYWNRKMGFEFKYEHISDSSAINQWHPGGEGSYDSWDIERFSGGRIKLQGCPKGKGSVEARVRLLQQKLFNDEVYVSALCKVTIDMLQHLISDKKDPTKPKRSKYIHKFDALSYPMLKLELNGMRNTLQIDEARPSLIHCGRQ
tara:strand:- start:4128 stop:5633 length:1506 start_codon:yes stop_codon:yes gene_type:complete